jgi:hypothetical protein
MPEYVGSIHVHSCYSDGSGTMREITAAACRAGLDFLVTTDHDTLRPRDDQWSGWRDDVLLVVGIEITCRGRSHVVVLGAGDIAGLRWKPLRRVLFDLQNQSAAAFVAHAHPAHIIGISLKAGELLDWDIPGFAGVELWSFMHDICDGMTPWRATSFVRTWPRFVRGPHPDTLAHWDRVTLGRRFPAIGSLDNHAVTVPVVGTQILPYEEGFRTLRTHIFCDEFTGRREDAALVQDALCQGRAFIAMDMWADARGFRFEADAGGEQLLMGEERPWSGTALLRAQSPVSAQVALLRNGGPVAQVSGTDLEFRADAPGVYRVEARYGGKPWVYTNPVYLRST